MLQGMTWQSFQGWIAYAELEPFDETRGDLRAASICSLLANIHRDRKIRPRPFEISDFLLEFGKDRTEIGSPKKQTWQQQKMIAQMMAIAFNEPPRKGRKKKVDGN